MTSVAQSILRAALDEMERTQASDDGLPTSLEASSSLTPVMPYLSRTGSEFDEVMAEMGTSSRLGSRLSTRVSSFENADRMSSTPIKDEASEALETGWVNLRVGYATSAVCSGQTTAPSQPVEQPESARHALVQTHWHAAAAPLLDSMPLVRVKRCRHR